MTLPNILSGISILLAASLVIWMKVISARAFKSIDDKIKDLHETVAGLDLSVRKVEKDIIRLTEFKKSVDKDIKHVKADLVREAQVMNNQMDTVHNKIDHIDNKLDKLRDNRR
jgi:predicted  nucleic acid-binding Zn-ribbon protein